jgi:ADP-heptose:LPS heptosyltransferase
VTGAAISSGEFTAEDTEWNEMSARRVVIFRPGALGDTLLAFLALGALRRVWPDAQVTLVARADTLALVRAARLADAAYSYDLPAWSGLWSEAPDGDPLLRAVVGGAEVVVAWLPDPNGSIARALSALGVARCVIAPGRPPASGPHSQSLARARAGAGQQPEHVACYLLRTLAPLGIGGPILPGPFLVTGIEEACGGQGARALAGERVVALHPGSGGAAKCWPPERFAEVARRLRAAGYAPLVVEGPADAERVAAMHEALGGAPVPVARGLAVEALAALLARCAAYVGNDSGVSHLAGLVGCPTLALFGPSDPALWAPVGPRVRVLRAPSAGTGVPRMSDLDEEAVWEALAGLLEGHG